MAAPIHNKRTPTMHSPLAIIANAKRDSCDAIPACPSITSMRMPNPNPHEVCRTYTSRLRPVAASCSAMLVGCAILGHTAHAQSPEAYRGQLLYESTCVQCHAESVHNRKQRIAQSFDDVRWYVTRWSKAAGKTWSADNIHDVTLYLNERYYRYPCPTASCKRESAGNPPIENRLAASPMRY